MAELKTKKRGFIFTQLIMQVQSLGFVDAPVMCILTFGDFRLLFTFDLVIGD